MAKKYFIIGIFAGIITAQCVIVPILGPELERIGICIADAIFDEGGE